MKVLNIILLALVLIFIPFVSPADDPVEWSMIDLDEKAEILSRVCEALDENLPNKSIVKKPEPGISIYDKYVGMYAEYINVLLGSVDHFADRESIEQSEYMSYGDPVVSEICLLIDTETHLVQGSYILVFQDGRDENGEEADINWTFSMRAGEDAKPLVDKSGVQYDDLYFEWSGH